jgi:hypothetical protein
MKKGFAIALVSLAWVSWTSITVELKKTLVLNDKVEILLPKEFEIMSEDIMRLKYPSERRATLIYTDKKGEINVAFNHTTFEATQQQIEAYKEHFVLAFKNAFPSADWKATGVKEINGRKVGYMELVSPAIDTKIYNLIFFTDLEGRLLLCTFNCIEKEQKDWIEPAQQIMNSMTIR